MKCSCGRWISLAALDSLLLGAVALGAEELRNTSFEEPLDSGLGYNWVSDRAVFWERWGGWFNRETSWSPVLSGQCLMAYHHWRIQGDETSGIYQDIPEAGAGQPYTFSIQVFRDKGANADFVEVRMETAQGGQTLASQLYKMADLKSGKWTRLTVTATPPTPGVRVLVIAKPGKSTQRKGALKFDEAAFVKAPKNGGPAPNDATWRASPYRLTRK
jgi:hypothetical protein